MNQNNEKKAVRELDLDRIREIQAKVKECLPEGVDSLDHGEVLYDENGLPE